MKLRLVVAGLCLLGLLPLLSAGQTFDVSYYQNMRWRCIGPGRAGRTVGAVGIPQQPHVFFIGVNNGGVWKTTDAGRTWQPIFDDQPTGSIGDVAVSPANPDVIWVGSGEGLQRPDLSTGDGIYKSTDGGKTWANVGLRNAKQIGGLAVDPKNPDRLFVAALGHPYGPNEERGVFLTDDGGKSWERVLYKDADTGAIQVTMDPNDPNIVYADMWAQRLAPWENGVWQGKNSGLYKSTNGGYTWKQLTKGLPTTDQGLGRIGFGIAPSNSNVIYATVDAGPLGGIYRSDDAGESWRRLSDDARLWGRGSDFAEIKVHPKNAEIVFVGNIASYKSTDGGKTWVGWKGAPGGDDYHRIWINPDHPDIILQATDQGATITVNGGQTWSSWYNQPTAQFYHVSTDNQWPYWVYGGQQESGSAAVKSRGDNGAITFRDWRTVGVEEYGYVAPDPRDPNIIYGGKITRFDKRTGQVQNIAPEAVRSGKYRFLRTAPVLFSPVDNKTLYFAGNVLFKTLDGGHSWAVISPDLTREKYDIAESIGVYRDPSMATMPRRGVIYTVAPSHKTLNTIWVGTDDGLIHVTRDGGRTWQNVTPPQLTSWSKVSLIDAGHSDDNTAYAAINSIRLNDYRPHILRTRDGGKTWQEIVNGLPDDPINAVREDPQRKGLLFAGSERAVFVSFNDGDDWQPLRLNMPAASIRDLVVHDDDIVVGTHGRSFWILDDITPLRQLTDQIGASDAHLFAPQLATRVMRNANTDTPLPPEEPAYQNPPDGAIINYYLKSPASSPVVLEIVDGKGQPVRRFASDDKAEPFREGVYPIPAYWARPPRVLPNAAGMQRFVWNLRYPDPPGARQSYPISAIYRDTPTEPHGPAVAPGVYTLKLTVNGKTYTQTLNVRMDPRVVTPALGLARQFALSMESYDGIKKTYEALTAIRNLRRQAAAARDKAGPGPVTDALAAFEKKLNELDGSAFRPAPGVVASVSLGKLNGDFLTLLNLLQDADATPTTQAVKAVNEAAAALKPLLARWETLKNTDLPALNKLLPANGQMTLSLGE
jgi:photosystem II stability/assembly factor-like uncharacterized protein